MYCVNCSHFVLSDASPKNPELGRCARTRTISLVTGVLKPISDLPFASTERTDKFNPQDSCGSAGIHFTAKEDAHV
jgi:hypothetical protein